MTHVWCVLLGDMAMQLRAYPVLRCEVHMTDGLFNLFKELPKDTCLDCLGTGKERCIITCHGFGRCRYCGNTGYTGYTCKACHGSGKRKSGRHERRVP